MIVKWHLTKPGEVSYRDRGYFGAPCKGYNATMKLATRGHPLNIREKAKSTHKTQKITRRTSIRRNKKHIPLRPHKSHHNTSNTHKKHLHLFLLQPHAIKHPQTKKHNLANANKKNENISQK